MARTSTRRRRGSSRSSRPGASGSDLDLGSDKLYFKIGEVAEIVGVPAYVLRYWESEFRSIRPQKSRSQQRVYRRGDVEMLLRIKHLLYAKKYTIAGARQEIEQSHREGRELEAATPNPSYKVRQSLERVREELAGLAALVRSDDALDPAGADPAEYLRARGGALAVMAGTADGSGESQPLLRRPERDAH
jgi:DNA-binding transcriptional MerR regulator